jgi:hypothetical protein
MKQTITLLTIFILNISLAMACPVCEKQQPKLLRGITHGAGPQSNWDWVIVGIIAAITLFTFLFSAKYLLFPKEKNADHIKHQILHQF